jgi:hypothetical protein
MNMKFCRDHIGPSDMRGLTMKRVILMAATAIALIAASQTAEARKISIGQKVSPNQLQAICAAAGGSFWSNDNGYSCIKANCDGKGHSCTVVCDLNADCTGYIPKNVPSQRKGLKDILNPSITDIH